MSTLFQRFRKDSSVAANRFTRILAHIQYKEHFDSIRSHTRKSSTYREAFSFIDLQDPPLPVVAQRNQQLPQFVRREVPVLQVRLFGSLVSASEVFDAETGLLRYTATLRNPNLDDSISRLFADQWATLESIMRIDDADTPGPITRSFGENSLHWQYITIWDTSPSLLDHDVGHVLELEATLQRHESAADADGLVSKASAIHFSTLLDVESLPGLPDLVVIVIHLLLLPFLPVMPSRATVLFTSVRDPTRPTLAVDRVGEHYIATRDKCVTDVCGPFDRFSYKEMFHQEIYERHLSPYRMQVPRYRPCFIGSVAGSELAYHDNPHMAETSGCYCNRILLQCPGGADSETVRLFNEQVRVLEEIIEIDVKETVNIWSNTCTIPLTLFPFLLPPSFLDLIVYSKPGEVLGGWIRSLKDGSKAIEVWTSLNDAGVQFDFPVGRDVEVVVNLCKDESYDCPVRGDTVKTFSLWLRSHNYLSDADIRYALAMTRTLASMYLRSTATTFPRQIALDKCGTDFVLTRDRTIRSVQELASGELALERFTYKSVAVDLFNARFPSTTFRLQVPLYEATLIGEVVDHQHIFTWNPLNLEGKGGECVRLLARCPRTTDKDTLQYFKMQVQALQAIVQQDLTESNGIARRSWLVDDPDDGFLIEILVAIPCIELRKHIAFRDGQAFQVTVNLCKDETLSENGSVDKFFSLWFREWSALSASDVGR
ncbi:hypothetical protein R3P38DRAFT_3187778 [Favolaschia claudopus]|uniref:Uncharacterized protein n=2 Tax=Favolaschia claudopus TaxID=2862362 RepID=A0AAW0BUI7_9AGAR